jgi:hypothetical protein
MLNTKLFFLLIPFIWIGNPSAENTKKKICIKKQVVNTSYQFPSILIIQL